MSVCLRPPFLDDRRSDLIETCQEYCRGPADVPFRGLISIGWAVPKLRPFICQPMTGHGAMTSRMTSQLMFIYLFIEYFFFFARLTLQFFFFVWYDITIDAGDLSMCLFKVWYQSDERFPSYSHFIAFFSVGKVYISQLKCRSTLSCHFFQN